MCLYAGLWISGNVSGRMMTWLFWVALIFFAVSYTDITAGHRGLFFLLPMVCVPMGILLYFYRRGILSGDLEAYKDCAADFLALAGVILTCLAVRVHPAEEYHPTWGDRPDGRKLRTLDPMAVVANYIMPTRGGSSNFIRESVEISAMERYIREKRKQGYTNVRIRKDISGNDRYVIAER